MIRAVRPFARNLVVNSRGLATAPGVIKSSPVNTNEPKKIVPQPAGMESVWGSLLNLVMSPMHLLGNGFITVPPNHVGVATYFSNYTGTKFNAGLQWTPTPIGTNIRNVFMGDRTVSLKSSKIIDSDGNPVLISGIMNYNIETPEQYLFGVHDAEEYIFNQAEKVLKKVVSRYPYDELSKEGDQIRDELVEMSQNSLDVTGIKVNDFSLTDMNYSTEIAQAMLVRQQARAYVDARGEVTKAACDIVEDVIRKFDGKLDKKAEAGLVKDLLVVITSNTNVQPVISVSQ